MQSAGEVIVKKIAKGRYQATQGFKAVLESALPNERRFQRLKAPLLLNKTEHSF